MAHVPAAPHPGPDHLPAGLSGTGQAVPLAAHDVSLIYPVTLGYFTATSYLFVHKKSGNLFHFFPHFFYVIFFFSSLAQQERETVVEKQRQDTVYKRRSRMGD